MQADIFDRNARRHAAIRAARADPGNQWLLHRMADELIDRLDSVKAPLTTALIIGRCGGYIAEKLAERGISSSHFEAEEDGLSLALPPAYCDLIVSCGTLDSVNDLPGALVQIRRTLKLGGLFLGAFTGAGSLAMLKDLFTQAQYTVCGNAAPRVHPQIDVRAAGDLLTRAGFDVPVADQDHIKVRYDRLLSLVADLRAMGWSNCLVSRQTLHRATYDAACQEFAVAAADDGKVEERMCPIYLTGWGPLI